MKTYTNEVEELRAANAALIHSNATLRKQRNAARAELTAAQEVARDTQASQRIDSANLLAAYAERDQLRAELTRVNEQLAGARGYTAMPAISTTAKMQVEVDTQRGRVLQLQQRVAELERDNEHLRMEDGLSKFYRMQERVAELEHDAEFQKQYAEAGDVKLAQERATNVGLGNQLDAAKELARHRHEVHELMTVQRNEARAERDGWKNRAEQSEQRNAELVAALKETCGYFDKSCLLRQHIDAALACAESATPKEVKS